jgi:hypothetical protein
MAEPISDSSVPEQAGEPELTQEIRASNKRGLWVLLALAVLAAVIVAVVGVKDIFDGPWR